MVNQTEPYQASMHAYHGCSDNIGYVWMMPTAALPKLASQFFGADFCRRGLAKILARICESSSSGPMGSQKIGNTPNK
jgi:hypothetical protein